MSNENGIVSDRLAEANAKKYLRKVDDAAIIRLQEGLKNGTFHGRWHRTCFFGHLAAGAGYNFTNKVRPDRTLGQFLKNLGVRRTVEDKPELEPIEFYCLGIGFGQTVLNNERARNIYDWCDEVLDERRAPALGSDFDLLSDPSRVLAGV